MTTQRVDISVFGRSFRVNCPTQQKEALELAALDLDNRLTELKNRTGVSNVEQLVFIAALNVCHELAQERTKTAEYAHSMEARIRLLQDTIEQALLQHTTVDSLAKHQSEYTIPEFTTQVADIPPSLPEQVSGSDVFSDAESFEQTEINQNQENEL